LLYGHQRRREWRTLGRCRVAPGHLTNLTCGQEFFCVEVHICFSQPLAFRQVAPAVAFKIPAIQGRQTTVALATDNIERSKVGAVRLYGEFHATDGKRS
jgi:hypothetical protein